ncbi:hypothetical protein [Sphingomonas bacterium]|uniref:hypothetical protein n=1 Tax=Sphingomonas bacterium TaxID=1895847 RepID=UPI001577415D|nr:hypothetical protein [Sphingomonas bacterium]
MSARHRFARSSRVEVQDGRVRMSAERGTVLRHASDTPGDMGVVFGGDTLGHWNVDRINRILDAFDAPVHHLPVPIEKMLGMARVGDPDPDRAHRYAAQGLATMPPLSFVSMVLDRTGPSTLTTLLVDGHHRMMALYLLDVTVVPARVLPSQLVDDVRVVEMSQLVTFPEPTFSGRRVVTGSGSA